MKTRTTIRTTLSSILIKYHFFSKSNSNRLFTILFLVGSVYAVQGQSNCLVEAVCEDITVQINGDGPPPISGAAIDGGSTSTCGIASMQATPDELVCFFGNQPVTLTVTDDNNNTGTCVATVTLEEGPSPDIVIENSEVCYGSAVELSIVGLPGTRYLGSGNGVPTAFTFDVTADASGEAIVVAPIMSSAGMYQVTINSIRYGDCPVGVNITEEYEVIAPPLALCDDITIELDPNGQATIDYSEIDNGSTADCGLESISLDITEFDCDDLGVNDVVLTVVDINDNEASCVSEMTVEDDSDPVVDCMDIVIELDHQTSSVSVGVADIDDGSYDNCSVDLSVASNTFDCNNAGVNIVVLTGVDGSDNTSDCEAEVTILLPEQPEAENCWDDYVFDFDDCVWINMGVQPIAPEEVNCWDDFVLDNNSCTYVNQGVEPEHPEADCWDDYEFDPVDCVWVNNGSQPQQPEAENCWDDYEFDFDACIWINNGIQPEQPDVENCWDDYAFDFDDCIWVNNGTQPEQPEVEDCWDDYVFDDDDCIWINIGVQPIEPAPVHCWQDFVFDNDNCVWVSVGVQPNQPTRENCWDDYVFDNILCEWLNQGVEPMAPSIFIAQEAYCTLGPIEVCLVGEPNSVYVIESNVQGYFSIVEIYTDNNGEGCSDVFADINDEIIDAGTYNVSVAHMLIDDCTVDYIGIDYEFVICEMPQISGCAGARDEQGPIDFYNDTDGDGIWEDCNNIICSGEEFSLSVGRSDNVANTTLTWIIDIDQSNPNLSMPNYGQVVQTYIGEQYQAYPGGVINTSASLQCFDIEVIALNADCGEDCASDITLEVCVMPEPTIPSEINCYDDYVFDEETCTYVNEGAQPTVPQVVNCWDVFEFDNTQCEWINTGLEPEEPEAVNCYDEYYYENDICAWVNIGEEPIVPPFINCWDDFNLNPSTCTYDNVGVQPSAPAAVNCWDDYEFDNSSCLWVNVGVRPLPPPSFHCWDIFVFDNITCEWTNQGVPPVLPSYDNCWDYFVLDTESCTYVNIGAQPLPPAAVNCYDDFFFDDDNCIWINIGVAPVQPPADNCWDNYVINTTTCTYVNVGEMPTEPEVIQCYDRFEFDTDACEWINTGEAPVQPEIDNCWDDFVLDNSTCRYVNIGEMPEQPELVHCYDLYEFDRFFCDWVNVGQQPKAPEAFHCYDDYRFDDRRCEWVNEGPQFNIRECTGDRFISLTTGAIVSDQLAGVTIFGEHPTAKDNRAMIHNSNDTLASGTSILADLGQILVISQAEESVDSETDDEGGTFHFVFDSTQFVNTVDFVNIQSDNGSIILRDKSGLIISVFTIPRTGAGESATVDIYRSEVATMEVYIPLSGAISDFCTRDMREIPACIDSFDEICSSIRFDNFDRSWEFWLDGGGDVASAIWPGSEDDRSLRLRDNSSSSYSSTVALDLRLSSTVHIGFEFHTVGMERNEDFFLEYSLDGGTSWMVAEQWVESVDFDDDKTYCESVLISDNFTRDTRFRFRSNGGDNTDLVYIDDVRVDACLTAPDSHCNGEAIVMPIGDSCYDYFQFDVATCSYQNIGIVPATNILPTLSCPDTLSLTYAGIDGQDVAIARWLSTAIATDECSNVFVPDNNYDIRDFSECVAFGIQTVTFTNAALSCTAVIDVNLDAGPQCAGGQLESLDAGDLVSRQVSEVNIFGASTRTRDNRAMILDTTNPSDTTVSLAAFDYGKILIISQDGDPHNPTADTVGGTLFFDFNNPQFVSYVQLLDVRDNGGFVQLLDDRGSEILSKTIPSRTDTLFQQLNLNAFNVSRMIVHLAGSGAIADYCITDHIPACYTTDGQCQVTRTDNFDEDHDFWLDGGADSDIVTWPLDEANYSVRLRDSSGEESAISTPDLDYRAVDNLMVSFDYYAVSMESEEQFLLEYSLDAGLNWITARQWESGLDFYNDEIRSDQVAISGPFSSETRLRFRCDASTNSDQVYLDNIDIETCVEPLGGVPADVCSASITEVRLDPNDNTLPLTLRDGMILCASSFIDHQVHIEALTADVTGSILFSIETPDGFFTNLANDTKDSSLRFGSRAPGNYRVSVKLYSEANLGGSLCDEMVLHYVVEAYADCTDVSDLTCLETFDFETFESDWGIWNDGGGDSRRYDDEDTAADGLYSVRLRDNSSSSHIYTDLLPFAKVNSIQVDFEYTTRAASTGDSFMVEFSTDGGDSWTILRMWSAETDFENDSTYIASVAFSAAFSDRTTLRIRNAMSTNLSELYLDAITVSTCGELGIIPSDGPIYNAVDGEMHSSVYTETLKADSGLINTRSMVTHSLTVYPNPAVTTMTVEGLLDGESYDIIDITGVVVVNGLMTPTVDLSGLRTGTYLIRTSSGAIQKFIKL